ncbi:MAG: VWA domain-containing protein [Acidobacteriota bacterium]
MMRFYQAISILVIMLPVWLVTAAINSFAQENDDEILRVESAVVFCDVGVRDAQGKTIGNLPADNFLIYEDSILQNIEHFINTPGPIDLVLAFDISGSTNSKLKVMRQTATNFISKLAKTDQVALIQFDDKAELLTGFTNNPLLIERAIAALGKRMGYGSSIYDAMIFAGELFKNNSSNNHKAMLIITDGVDNASHANFQEVKIMLANQSASLYFIDLDTEADITVNYFGIPGTPFTPKQLEKYYRSFSLTDRAVKELMAQRIDFSKDFIFSVIHFLYKLADREMQELAEYMGGRVYKVSRIEDLDEQYQIILDDLRRLYTIGYYPIRNSQDRGFHKITIKSKKPNLTLSYRRGYRAVD